MAKISKDNKKMLKFSDFTNSINHLVNRLAGGI